MSDPDLMAERDKAFSNFFAAVSQTTGTTDPDQAAMEARPS